MRSRGIHGVGEMSAYAHEVRRRGLWVRPPRRVAFDLDCRSGSRFIANLGGMAAMSLTVMGYERALGLSPLTATRQDTAATPLPPSDGWSS